MKRASEYDLEMIYKKPFRTSSSFNPWDQVGRNILARRAAGKRLAVSRARTGYSRKTGFYGRYGQAALANGLVPEMKFLDTVLGFDFDTTGEVPPTGQLNLVVQGDGESQRDGRQCTVMSIHIRGKATYLPGANALAAGSSFLVLVQDMQCNGAAAATTDVYTANTLWAAHVNLANSKRFKIIKRWKWVSIATAGVTTAYNSSVKLIDWYKKINVPLEFSGSTGALTEIKSNNLFLLAGTDGNIDDQVSFSGICRIRFRG